MARTVDFKFNEPSHELKAGSRTAGRPYFVVSQNSAAGESYFTTLETLNKVTIAVPDNPHHVKGMLSVYINERHLYTGSLEALEAQKTESFDVIPPIGAGNHLSVRIDCKEVSGDKPYMVQLQLS
ncbi:MAG TPA: hypothetical protein VL944_02295 [Candidatus Acidoferrum sp.]|nr:hypothetical protein [Candidatus Acidoferrum sp.]